MDDFAEKFREAHTIESLQARVEELEEALKFAVRAIRDAICLEDGLDGAAGEAVLRMIKEALEPKVREAPSD